MQEKQLELWNNLKNDNTLMQIQEYLERVIEIRGFSDESIEETMLILTEEVRDFAKAIRKEKQILKWIIIKLLKNKKVTDISEMSHREDGWKKTKRLEKISFEYAMNLNIIK